MSIEDAMTSDVYVVPMTPDTAELRRLAEAATPGPWETIGSAIARRGVLVGRAECDGEDHSTGEDLPDEEVERTELADAAYIAAVSPDVVLALLDEIERLKRG